MIKPLILALALLTPIVAHAEDAPLLAEFFANSGSLPPEYAWDVAVTILADGKLTLKHCTGYETSGPACKTRNAKTSEAALAAIRTAAAEAGLADKPALTANPEDIPIGGGTTSGSVTLGGLKLNLPAFPVAADKPRVAAVLAAIYAAIPARLSNRFIKGN